MVQHYVYAQTYPSPCPMRTALATLTAMITYPARTTTKHTQTHAHTKACTANTTLVIMEMNNKASSCLKIGRKKELTTTPMVGGWLVDGWWMVGGWLVDGWRRHHVHVRSFFSRQPCDLGAYCHQSRTTGTWFNLEQVWTNIDKLCMCIQSTGF